MARPAFEVWLDEELQIVRQRLNEEPDVELFRQVLAETRACAARLRRPSVVRILAAGAWSGRMPRAVRAAAMVAMRDPELQRIAIVNRRRLVRVLIRFLSVAAGLDKARVFSDEEAAVRWLLS